MNFHHYLLEIEKVDRALYAMRSTPEIIAKLDSHIKHLELKDPGNSQAIEQLKKRKKLIQEELTQKTTEAEFLITQLLKLAQENHGRDVEKHLQKIITNLKIAHKIISDPNPISSQEYHLPADLMRVVPEANNHGFRLKMYQELLPYTRLAYAIEQNGSPEEHAYKLAVLFDNPESEPMKHVMNYWRMVAMENANDAQFIHNSCLFELPRGSGWTVEAWRGFVRADLLNFIKGDRGIALCLSEAERIEEKLLTKREDTKKKVWIKKRQSEVEKKAKKSQAESQASGSPQRTQAPATTRDPEQLWQQEWQKQKPSILSQISVKELTEVYSSLTYARGDEHPEAASLFRRYGMSEIDFNKYLDLKPKDSNNIPYVMVGGNRISPELKNYYIKKLDPRDPMCAVLGKKTGCCQSIGGAGEACAIHGITSEDGGFYVLCAGDPKNPKPTDDIRAQCWAWRSKTGALVFDSVELTKPIRESKVGSYIGTEFVSLMYAQLAFDLVENPQYGIHAVNVGVGGLGATPEMLGVFNANIEHPKDYEGYRDSTNQRMIANGASLQISKGFYDLLNNLIIYARNPSTQIELQLNQSLEKHSLEDSIYILAQCILYDRNKTIVNKTLIQKLLHTVRENHTAQMDSKSAQMLAIIEGLVDDTNQLERAKRLASLYDLGLSPTHSFSFPEDSTDNTVMAGNKNILEVLLKAGDYTTVNRLLDQGVKVEGNVLLWALTDVSLFPMPVKKMAPEQLQMVRRLIKAGANCNAEASWWNSLILSPLDILIMTGNSDFVDEFLASPIDRAKGQPVATAMSQADNELMMKFVGLGFSAAKGDVISAYIQSNGENAKMEVIEELIRLGADTAQTNAIFAATQPNCPPRLAVQLIERNIGTSSESLNSIFAHLILNKHYEVANRVMDKISNLGEVTFDNEYSPENPKIALIPKTPLIRLIEDNQFTLAKRVIDQGASIQVQAATFPDDRYAYLKHDKTNFVVAACLAQNSDEAYLFALEVIAKGAPITGVDLTQVENNERIGDKLVKLAKHTDNQAALTKLKAAGFSEPDKRPKNVKFNDSEKQKFATTQDQKEPASTFKPGHS